MVVSLVAFVGRLDAFSPLNNKKVYAPTKKLFSVAIDEATWTSETRVPVFDEVCETTGVTLTRFMNEVGNRMSMTLAFENERRSGMRFIRAWLFCLLRI